MTDEDVRDMLAERAAAIRPSTDGLAKIEARLASEPVAARRRLPVPMLAAAAVTVLAMVGVTVFVQRDDETSVDSGPVATAPVAPAADVPLGVWPWPGDDVDEAVFDDAGDTARAYVASRVLEIGATTEVGRNETADGVDVVFGGDVATTVHLRRDGDRWYVEASSSDLVTLHDVGDGSVTARIEVAGELVRTTAVSGASAASTVTAQVEGGEEYPGLGYTLGRDDAAQRELFVLGAVDGTTAIAEIAFRASTEPDLPATAAPPGVWPWPGDFAANEDAWLTDPRETALRYALFRFGGDLGETVASDFQQGDANSGEVVLTGDVSTTVLVRRLDGVWHVEAAVTDLLELQVDGDEVSWTVPRGGELTGNAEGAGVEPDPRGPVRIEPGSGGGIELTEATGVVRHWFTIVGDDGTTGLAEVRVDHGDTARESSIPDDAVFEEGGLDASAVVWAYLADRLESSEHVTIVNEPTYEGDRAEVTWNAGVIRLRQQPDGYWYVIEAIGDSVQIGSVRSANTDAAGQLDVEIQVAEPGVLHITDTSSMGTVDLEVDDAGEGTIVPFRTGNESSWPGPLLVVFETDAGFVSLAEGVIDG